ncbi:MAG: hypothetical protein EON90_12330 [Brevundimonas sp.]|nr:MAG: hypothetical protein EON90_12330 [Brevundimonas sp.]
MRLVLTDSLFQAADDLEVLGLLHRALGRRCYLAVRSPQADAYLRWHQALTPARREAWDRQLEWTLRDGAVHRIRSVEVVADGFCDWTASPVRLTAAEATRLVDLPFYILLENSRYDRAFLLALAPPAHRPLLERLEAEGRIVFRGVGGLNELRLVVEQQIAPRAERRLSHWALFDSDAAAPGLASADAISVSETCQAADVPFHMLERRAIENYVPTGALYDWADAGYRTAKARRHLLSALFSLTPAQRHHFHFKSGFSAAPTQQEQELYADVPSAIRATLENGISGAEIGRLFHNDLRGRIRAQVDKEGAGAELAPSLARLMELLRVPHG